MCLLTVFPMPDLLTDRMAERLGNGAYLNPHGSGWAVIVGRGVVTGKSLDSEYAIESFARAYRQATGPAIFHSRWATHGEKTVLNVHPFPVRKMPNTYLAHNGIMPAEALPDRDDDRSDTRVFADDILPIRYPRLDNAKVRQHLGNWLGANKIAVLTTNRRFSRNLYVFGLDQGEWVDGAWFSNSDHEGYGRYRHLFTDARQPASKEACVWCHCETVNDFDVCNTCGTCQDCWEPMRSCQCYIGSSSEVKQFVEEASAPTNPREDFDAPPVILGRKAPKAIEGPSV